MPRKGLDAVVREVTRKMPHELGTASLDRVLSRRVNPAKMLGEKGLIVGHKPLIRKRMSSVSPLTGHDIIGAGLIVGAGLAQLHPARYRPCRLATVPLATTSILSVEAAKARWSCHSTGCLGVRRFPGGGTHSGTNSGMRAEVEGHECGGFRCYNYVLIAASRAIVAMVPDGYGSRRCCHNRRTGIIRHVESWMLVERLCRVHSMG